MADEMPMEPRVRERLRKLREEFANGQAQLTQVESRARDLREMLLRIAGAIQVLTEVLGEDEAEEKPPEG
jgi:hypothetical protein